MVDIVALLVILAVLALIIIYCCLVVAGRRSREEECQEYLYETRQHLAYTSMPQIFETFEWIAVTDCLPEIWRDVLVYRKDGIYFIDCVGPDLTWRRGYQSLVTHWMPLPAPPKEDT